MVFKCQFNELKLLTCIRMVKRLTKYKKKSILIHMIKYILWWGNREKDK